MVKAATDLSYCGREVRKYDNDHFLAGLFTPADRREATFALYAFNLEIAKTRGSAGPVRSAPPAGSPTRVVRAATGDGAGLASAR